MMEISQVEYDKIFENAYMSGKFENATDIYDWMDKHWTVKEQGA